MKLVFDIGATHTRLAQTDGKSLFKIQRFSTDSTKKGLEHFLTTVDSYLDGDKVSGFVGGLPGQIDHQTGRLVHSPNLTAWQGHRVAKQIEQHLGVRGQIHNDVELVGLGEAVHGAGRGENIVAYITVSTGVNGVRVVNGAIDPSARGFELGAQLVTDKHGHITQLEAVTGGAALSRRFHQPPAQLKSHRLWRTEARYLSQGLYNTILHWSPDIVVLGGSMMRDIELEEIVADLERLPEVYADWPPVVRGTLGDDGGLHGAMVLANASKA